MPTLGRKSVWVTHLSWPGGQYFSVHATKLGAERRLVSQASSLGINLRLIDAGIDQTNSYGLSLMEIER